MALERLKAKTGPAAVEPQAPAAAPQAETQRPAAAPGPTLIHVAPDDVEHATEAYDQLSTRHQIFVDHILTGVTPTEAARLCDYGPGRPEIAAHKLLANPTIKKAIADKRRVAAEAAGLDMMALMTEMADIAYGRKAVDSDVVRMRALENCIKWVEGSKGTNENTNVAQGIRQRFQRARLSPGGMPSHLKLVK